MTQSPYSPGRHGPTLLYIFQSYVSGGTTSEEAAARLDGEIKVGEMEVSPVLPPGARLVPKKGERHSRMVEDVSTVDGITSRILTPSETDFYYGPPRLDVVDAKGKRTDAGKFYARQCTTLRPPPSLPAEPVVTLGVLKQLAMNIAAQLAMSEKSKPKVVQADKRVTEALAWIATVENLKGWKKRCADTCKTQWGIGSHVFNTQVWSVESTRRVPLDDTKIGKSKPKRRAKN